MSQLRRLLTLTTFALLFCAPGVQAGFDGDFEGNGADHSYSKYSIGFGSDYRIDELDYRDYVPSVNAQFWYALNRTVALRFGLLHNSFTRVEPATGFHEFSADLGLRVYFTPRTVTPYIESGFHFPYYWGTDWGYRFHDFHPGLRLAAGLAVGLSHTIALDLTVSQVINHMGEEVVAVSPIPPIDGLIDFSRDDPDVGYNAVRVALAFRFGL